MRRRGFIIALALTVFVIGGVLYYNHLEKTATVFQVAFLDVGQGDSALIRFTTGEKMLIDCGADRTVLGQLGNQMPFYDRTIDFLLITHYDLDHYGGCLDILERYSVTRIVTTGDIKQKDPMWKAWQQAVEDEKTEVIIISQTTTKWIGGLEFNFLWPDPTATLDEKFLSSNNKSIVFQMRAAQTYLFSGDIEEPVERILVGKYCYDSTSDILNCPYLQSDVLKISHHGSDTSSSEEFLRAVQPKKVVISVSKTNRFGHPSQRVVKRLERLPTTILRTDAFGVILSP